MSRQQDTVIDDDEESCPLCIEEFDLSDKNFRPCPCGYQICQFCFNSLKNTYEKSTCPNCRRPYDEKTIQYKIPSAEEFKADQLNKTKRQAAAKRKDIEKKEVEASSRRNLAGVRVKQQNLVYVIGLVPQIKDEQSLLQTLRGPEYFGQYGDIDKIVVSKAKPGAPNQGVGVYVTYAQKEDAALCIQTIDGSVNGDRVLRAQFGTTKYCSAFLRGETCTNKNCSFLHETGEDGHNSSLQNEPHTKKPPSTAPSGMVPPPRPHSTAQSISSQPMARQGSKDSDERKGSIDSSALPSTASWANAPPPKAIRRPSQSTSRATPSPQLTHAALALQKIESKTKDSVTTVPSNPAEPETPAPRAEASTAAPTSPPLQLSFDPIQSVFDSVVRNLSSQPFQFVFSDSCLSEEEKEEVENFPVMIDPYGGAKRRVMQDKEAAERARLEADVKVKLEAQARSAAEEALDDENMGAGSLALGGEPEENLRSTSARGAIGRPSQGTFMTDQFSNMSLRSLSPQQRQQLGLQAPGLPQPSTSNTASAMSEFDRLAPTFSQAQYEQISNHQRHGSRYFNNESKSASSRFQGQQQSFYSSGVQGPPPGLPASGTPPVSGGGMFAHGNNFSNPGFGTAKDTNAELSMRGRSGTNVVPDGSKRGGVEHPADPSIVQARLHQGTNAGQGLFGGNQGGYQQMYGGGGGGYTLDEKNFPPLPIRAETQSALHSRVSSFQSLPGSKERSSTPRVPPGFETTHGHPESAESLEAMSSQPAPQKTIVATVPVLPAVPILPAVPRSSTPKPAGKGEAAFAKQEDSGVDDEIGLTTNKNAQAPNVNLGSPMPKASRVTNQQTKNEKAPTRERSKEEAVPASKSPTKRAETKVKEGSRAQRPSKIEIPAVVAAETTSRNVIGDGKPITPVASGIVATPPLMSPHPATPATTTSEVSRASVPRPRTLRVTTGGTQKIATEPAPPSTTTEHSTPIFPPSVASHSHPKPGVASRQLSVSSNAKVDSQSQSQSRPSTPAMSERLMSEGVSRPGSPPPSIVGSAPERARTKNQLKKERREKARTQNISIDSTKESISTVAAAAATEEVGPIVARQKKQKRSKAQQLDAEDDKANEPVRDAEDTFPTDEKDEAEPASSNSSRAASKPDTPVHPLPPIAQESYTVRQLYADAASIRPEYRDKYNMVRGLLQHRVSEAKAKKIISNMIATGDLTKDHPWLNQANFSFNSAQYKLPSDGRKGQDYLDAHGYVGNHAFGYVYLPARKKRALEKGNAVGIPNSANTDGTRDNAGKGKKEHQEDLLKRCLITPTGTVYRHLTAAESDKMLELEERRQFYVEEFGEDVGGMHALDKPLEIDDHINLSGGMEELGGYGERHGVVWVSAADDHEPGDQDFDDEGEHDGMDEDAGIISDETDDLGIDLDPGSVVPGAWDAGLQAGMPLGAAIDAASQQPPNTLAPMRNQPSAVTQQQNINLRALDLDTLQKRVAQKQKELEAARKEMEKMEKAVGKRNREIGKWREGLLKA